LGGGFLSLLLLALLLAGPLRAQDALPPLDQLLAPVALYPDPLIGLVLTASTYPADLQAAASYLGQGGDPNQISAQPWNDSVKGLAHYPDVVKWMSDNLPWTQQLGAAFASQPTDVMNAVQDLRSRARAAGTLASSPQQTVVVEDSAIAIEPAQSDEIYVPLYDPAVVYYAPPPGYYGGPFITFGSPYPMGIWLGFDFDWRGRRLWAGDWYTWRRDHGGWSHPYDPRDRRFAGFAGRAQAWHPPANAPRVDISVSLRAGFAAPRPMRGTPPGPRAGANIHFAPVAPRAEAVAHENHAAPQQAGPRPVHEESNAERGATHAAPHAEPGRPAAEPGRPVEHKPAPKPKPPVHRPPPRPEEHKEEHKE
jgi:hypothetical protein